MWQPPTDNLYKFIAIAGLVLFALGLYVPLLKLDDYNLQVAKWNAAYIPLLTKLSQSSGVGLEQLRCSIDMADKRGPMHPGRVKQCAEIEAGRPKHAEESKALAVSIDELASQSRVWTYMRDAVIAYQIGGFVVAAIGAMMAGVGFRLWYTRVQKFLDAEAVEKAKLPAGENAA